MGAPLARFDNRWIPRHGPRRRRSSRAAGRV